MRKIISRLKGIRIIQSIILIAVLSIIAVSVTGLTGSLNASRQYAAINEINSEVIPNLKSWGDVNGYVALLQNSVIKIIDRDYEEKMVTELMDMDAKIQGIIAQNIEAAQDNPTELKLVENVESYYSTYTSFFPGIIDLRKNNRTIGKQLANVAMVKAGDELTAAIVEVVNYQEQKAVEKSQYSEKIYSNGVTLATGIFILSLIVLSAISVITVMMIRGSIRSFTTKLHVVAEGDLTQRFDASSRNEFGIMNRALNQTLESIGNTLKLIEKDSVTLTNQTESLSASSGMMHTTVGEVSIAIQGVSQGSTNQAEELMYMNESFHSLSEQLESITTAIETVDQATKMINDKAESSSTELNGLVASVKGIEDSFGDTQGKINSLMTSINRVTEITKFIGEISKQTNLLSLNASIEASRAGEAGRGFAVVANEIRNLADQSRSSSQGIDDLLHVINNEMRLVSETAENTSHVLAEQSAVVEATMVSISEIIHSIQLILPQIAGVASSVNELNENKNKILLTVESTSAVSEENSASAEEISASTIELASNYSEITDAIHELEQVAKDMIQAVKRFRLE